MGEISNLEQSVTVVTYPIPSMLNIHIALSYYAAEFQETVALFYIQALFNIFGMATRSVSENRDPYIPELTYDNKRAL